MHLELGELLAQWLGGLLCQIAPGTFSTERRCLNYINTAYQEKVFQDHDCTGFCNVVHPYQFVVRLCAFR